jgi:XTP/dITP diphosphohydrolase
MKFIAATNNKGKLRELEYLLSKLGCELLSLEKADFSGEIEENGKTFEENALIKAETVMKSTGLAAIADDSGIEVDALGGAPGIHSARFAGPGMHVVKLLDVLRDVPEGKRGARFVSAIACAFPDGDRIVVRGECKGEILFEARGTGGFGYDPVFYVPEYGQTFAEMPAELKNRISHRAHALDLLIKELKGRI